MSHAKTAQVAEEIVAQAIRKAGAAQLMILRDTIAPMVTEIERLRRDVDRLKAQSNQQGAGLAPGEGSDHPEEKTA